MQPFLDLILQSPILLYYTVLNLGVALLYLVDKLKALGRRWRISEITLLLPAVVGGAFGGLLGMLIFKHKTRTAKFWGINGIFAAVHLVILYVLTRNGLIPVLPL